MKNFKRISSLIVALVMIVATMSAMFVTASAAEIKAGDKFDFDLALAAPGAEGTVVESACWKLAALEKSTGKILPVTKATEQTWAPEWFGLWVANAEGGHLNTNYVFSKSEFYNANIDLRDRDGYAAAFIFTAPVNGVYTLSSNIRVNESTTVRAYVRGQTTDLFKETKDNKNDIISVVAADVELKAGDMIVIVTQEGNTAGKCRAGIINGETSVTITEVKAATPAPGGNTGSNPETGDALVASIVVALVAGTAIVVSKKRR